MQSRLALLNALFPLAGVGLVFSGTACAQAQPQIQTIKANLKAYRKSSGITIRQEGSRLRASWPMGSKEFGVLTLELKSDEPLISELSTADSATGKTTPILQNVNPQTVLTVGSRNLKDPAGWVAFFDKVPSRPYQSYLAKLEKKSVRVESNGQHSTIIIGDLTAGPFSGDLRFTLYPGTRLIQAQSVLSTNQDGAAILYDTGLSSATPAGTKLRFLDNFDNWQEADAGSTTTSTPVAVRNRAIIAETGAGSVAIFPHPHQYFYPLDLPDNFKFAWHGRGYHDMVSDWGFGIRQPPEGDKRWVPWVNSPPGTKQEISVFYLLSRGKAETALDEVKRYTHGDRFKKLPGYLTFTSHYHMEHTLDFVNAQKAQHTDGVPSDMVEPPFVKAFKARGVDIAHLAEFHINWTPELTAQRLPLLKTMHQECERLSNDQFLLLPGEEPNEHLGGHWLSFFAKPVYWTFRRAADQPFVEQVEGYGTVYHVSNGDDILRMMEAEKGLMWTAHARIKASIGYPDKYKTEPFFLSDRFLGAAWKAMPSDLSKPQLGTRILDLEDDMSNWGLKKYILGEVDVFDIKPEDELYGHMNVNYLKLDKLPHYKDGWGSILSVLRNGQFFVTTGEVLIPKFNLGGKESGETLRLTAGKKPQLEASLDWTFPLNFAEIISGDGSKVYRQRIDLHDTRAFGTRELRIPAELAGRKWARFEVWDIAGNGAFTEPVWLE